VNAIYPAITSTLARSMHLYKRCISGGDILTVYANYCHWLSISFESGKIRHQTEEWRVLLSSAHFLWYQ